jgi:UDP-N-acetylglucosamine 1-carboxyvinyltransferase
MQQFVIEGGRPLIGAVTASGNKNAALPLLAACLMTDQPVTLRNLPDIEDVRTMKQLLRQLGASVEEVEPGTVRVQARDIATVRADEELCRHIRASILLAGPMLARTGRLELPPPGGDVIGRRRVDTHVLALRALGAEVNWDRDQNLFFWRADQLRGTTILLDEASVTGTENAIMAAAMAQGTTVIRNAASEPHVQELCHLLNSMGANIRNIGSNTLVIEGVDKLGGGECAVGADYLEVGSYIGLAVCTGGEITIRNASPEHLDMIRLVFGRLGVRFGISGDDVVIPPAQDLRISQDLDGAIPNIRDMPWPGFPTDLMSIAIVIATQAHGTILFHEWMFENRLYFVDKLIRMGAHIVLCDPHRCVIEGPMRLRGQLMESPDIRAGMALLIAALSARGTSIIRNISQIDRGYEDIDGKLRALGARIERVIV